MKIALECKDIMLEKALELFLREHLVMKKDCDFIISDVKIPSSKPLFIIHKNSPFLSLPFSKEMLLKNLNEFDVALQLSMQKRVEEEKRILEEKIDRIAESFKKDYQSQIDLAIKNLKDALVKSLIQ